MKIRIEHNLPKDEIIRRMQKVFEELKDQYASDVTIQEEKWQGDRATIAAVAKGIKVKSMLLVGEEAVEFDLQLPLMLRMFESQIRTEFENEFRKRILEQDE